MRHRFARTLHQRCSESVAPYRFEAAARPYPRETALLRCDVLALSVRVALDRLVPPLGRACAAFLDAGGWRRFGYARSGDHARERFGRSGRWLRELAALGAAFERLPRLADAVAGTGSGPSIGRVAATIISRVAVPESLQAWVDAARRVPVRTLREMAASARREGSVWPLPVDAGPAAAEGGATSDDTAKLATARAVSSLCDPAARIAAGAATQDCAAMTAPTPTLDSGTAAASLLDDTDDDQDRADDVLVRMAVPASVAAAFEESLDLYRALVGTQGATVAEFVEALVADAHAGPHPADAQAAPLGSARGAHTRDDGAIRSRREKNLARSTAHWSHLTGNTAAAPDWAFALAGMSLAALEDVCSRAGTGGVVELDAQIQALIHLEDDLERRLAGLLADMASQNAWARLRFDSVGHYAEQRLGMSRSAAQDRVRAQRGLTRLPVVRTAYERGDIGLDAALILVRILERGGGASEGKQRAWVHRAREATTKRLRDEERLMGRMRAVGAGYCVGPRDNPDLRETTGMPPDDAVWQRSLRREPGSSRRRIAFHGRVALANPQGDTFFRLRLPAQLSSAFLSCVESARERLARVAEEVPWDQPWPVEQGDTVPASLLCARMFSIRCRRSPAWVGLMAMLEEFADTWDDPLMSPRRPSDPVYVRDGWRCTAPGCSSRRNLEDHHIEYLSRGGSDELWNRTCLCRFHHQMGEHGGLASCRGVAPLGIQWILGRDGVGGRFRNEIREIRQASRGGT